VEFGGGVGVANSPAIISGVLALVAFLASAVVTFVEPEEKASQHLTAGRALGALRVRARQHRELDPHEQATLDQSRWRVYADDLSAAKAQADAAAPALSERRFRQARHKIRANRYKHDGIVE
jgi:hypothetical protein